jgi:hypothetical protein
VTCSTSLKVKGPLLVRLPLRAQRIQKYIRLSTQWERLCFTFAMTRGSKIELNHQRKGMHL